MKGPYAPPAGPAGQPSPGAHRRLKLQAVALEYGGHAAPVLVARGEGERAREILRRAQEQGIWVAQDPQLVALLSRVELEQEIPPELYTAVAVILSWVYWLRGMKPGDEKPDQTSW
ncbi:MAG: Flagellar biosynthetic protein FlhB [Pseudomonadota bacterium]